MKSERKSYFQWNAIATAFLLAGCAIFATMLIKNHALAKADLTEDKEYTLSEATVRILGSLPSRLQMKAYISDEVPGYVVPYRDKLKDILEEYRTSSKGLIAIDWIDPSEGLRRKEAEDAGVQFLSLQSIEQDKKVTKSIALGVLLRYRDREKLIPAVWITDLPTIEYQLTTAIKTLTDPKKTIVGFFTREEAAQPRFPGMEQPGGRIFNVARKSLEDRYALVDVDLKEGKPVPDEVNILVIARPKDVTDREKFELDQFIMRGGRAIFLVDRDEYPFEMNLMRRPIQIGLDDLFEQYGFRVEKELILDKSSLPIQVPGEVVEIMGQKAQMQRSIQYPFWIRAIAECFSKDHPITSRLDGAAFFWANPVTVLAEKAKGLKTEEIVHSTGVSYRTDQVDKTYPDEKALKTVVSSLAGKTPAPSTVALTLTGKFSSLYAGKEMPKTEKEKEDEKKKEEEKKAESGEKKEGEAAEENKEKPSEPQRPIITQSPETRLLVFGDSDFISDRTALKPNIILFINAIDWLSLDQDLIGIRSKNVRGRQIIDFEQEYEKQIGKTTVEVGMEDFEHPEKVDEKVQTARTNISQVEERASRTRSLIKYGNLLGMPALVVAVGLIRFISRRRRSGVSPEGVSSQ